MVEVRLQHLAEVFSGPREQRLERLGGNLHYFGNLGVTHALELAQQDGHPLALAQRLDRHPDDVANFGLVQLSRGHLAAAGLQHLVERPGAQRAAVVRLQRYLVTPRPVAQGIGGRVIGDGEQPRREFRPGLVGLPCPIHAQEHLLRQILGLLAVSDQMPQHGQQPTLVAGHQFLEGGGVVVAHLQHQPNIGIEGVSAGGGFADNHGRSCLSGVDFSDRGNASVYHTRRAATTRSLASATPRSAGQTGTRFFVAEMQVRENCRVAVVGYTWEDVMILLIDNYDSFTYNLVQRLGEIDPSLELEVHRNDKITLDEIEARRPPI